MAVITEDVIMKYQARNFFARSIITWTLPALAVSLALTFAANAADADASAKEQERALIQVLQSDAPPGDKAITCKKLAIYGTGEAVPALAPLLEDERLASWALIALEAIPGSAPDNALRQAAGKLHGSLLVGVIDSIGVRRDAKSARVLARKLNDSDTQVASAAAVSLGKIGGKQAASALRGALVKGHEAIRPAIAEGCIRCAESFLADGKNADAVKLYDAVRKASVPRERIFEGLRGAILARGTGGIPLLLEQLQSERSRLLLPRVAGGSRTSRQPGDRRGRGSICAGRTRTAAPAFARAGGTGRPGRDARCHRGGPERRKKAAACGH